MKKQLLPLKVFFVILLSPLLSFSQEEKVSISAFPSEGCAPFTTKLTANSSKANYFEWEINGKKYADKEITQTFFNDPNLLLTGYDTTGGKKEFVGHASNRAFNIKNPIYFHFSNDTICPNERIRIGSDRFKLTKMEFGDGNISSSEYTQYQYTLPGTYIIKIYGISQCGESFIYPKEIVVKDNLQPKPQIILSSKTLCPGETLNLYFYNVRFSSKYTWGFGDGTTVTQRDVKHSWKAEGLYTITLTETNACGISKTFSETISVSENLKISKNEIYAFADPKIACPQTKISFYIYNKQKFKSYVINFGDNQTASHLELDDYPKHEYLKPGKYVPSVKLTNFCGHDTTIVMDTIHIRTDVPWVDNNKDYYISAPDSVCLNEEFNFSFNSHEAISYSWDLGDGTTYDKESGTHSYNTTGEKNIKITLKNGCGLDFTTSHPVLVRDDMPAYIIEEITPISEINCPGDSVYFHLYKAGVKDLKWSFGNGQTTDISYIMHTDDEQYYYQKTTYKEPGAYTVKLEFSNYCGIKGQDSTIVYIKNNVTPDNGSVAITPIQPPITTCQPATFLAFEGNKFTWDFGDGTAPEVSGSLLTSHLFKQAGEYLIKLNVTNSCGNEVNVSDFIKVTDECSLVSTQEGIDAESSIEIYPNPVSSVSSIKINLISSSSINIYLRDGLGNQRIIKKDLLVNGTEEIPFNINNLNLAEGIYILCVEQEGKVISKKISVVK